MKLDKLRDPDYSPKLDTCLKAFVRLISNAASNEACQDAVCLLSEAPSDAMNEV